MIDLTQMAGLACVFMRMTGCILFNPIFGRRNFPAAFRVGMTLVLSVMIFTYSNVTADFGTGTFIETCVILLKEFFVGYALGAVVTMFTYTVMLAGAFVDMQMALSMAQMYDPQSGAQMSVSATFFNLMFIFTFFGMNAHLTLINMFMNSAQVVPYGEVTFVNPELSMHILDVFCQCTILGLKMAMPIAGMLFLTQMGVGILMKTVPQINAFVVMLQVKILGGLFMLAVVFSPLSNCIENLMTILFQAVGAVLLLM
jgi:flagellar biosynthetic protein FliR